jgi:hypothetical protein
LDYGTFTAEELFEIPPVHADGSLPEPDGGDLPSGNEVISSGARNPEPFGGFGYLHPIFPLAWFRLHVGLLVRLLPHGC